LGADAKSANQGWPTRCGDVSARPAHADGIWAVAWTEKTNRIVTGGVDERVNVWCVPALAAACRARNPQPDPCLA